MSKQLLPIGFYDLMFDEAKNSHQNINKILDHFFAAGYNLIKLPLVEFSDVFAPNQIDNSFRATDVISGKSLVFRSDITPQISRLLNTRLLDAKLPLKLCYVGDVLCAKSQDLYADRQQTQLGIEMIGCSLEESSLSVIATLFEALSSLNLQEFAPEKLLIEFSFPQFLDNFLTVIGEVDEEKNADLRQAIMKKNLSAISNLAQQNSDIISKIVLSNQNIEELIQAISEKISSDNIAKKAASDSDFVETAKEKIFDSLQKAQRIMQFLKDKKPQISVRFDLFGDQESSYHDDLSFDVFYDNFSYPIARGGSYKINSHKSFGATIYMNRLRKIK